MTVTTEPLPAFLAEPSKLGDEISVTGKWMPKRSGRLFRRSPDSRPMLEALDALQNAASSDPDVLSTEINRSVGGDAVLTHHVFRDAAALIGFFSDSASGQLTRLLDVAQPDMHLVRGISLPAEARDAITAHQIPVVFGEHLYGYVRADYKRPDLSTAINVTAKWTCKSGDSSKLDALKHWWQRVGTDAHSIEQGLLRFEAYQVIGEDALIIHETFENTGVLKFHLTKGTAKIYKKEIDKVAYAERYFFRGPVSWLIRTYSKFMRLPATYSRAHSLHTRPGGSMSEGTTQA